MRQQSLLAFRISSSGNLIFMQAQILRNKDVESSNHGKNGAKLKSHTSRI